MSTGIQLNQARAAYEAVGGVDYFTYDDFLAALRLYLNPAPVVCKKCGKELDLHGKNAWIRGVPFRHCPGAVWEASE